MLWLFGDSFINTKGSRSRRDAELVRNSLAIQTGRDPLTAVMKFYWKEASGKPASFFSEDGQEWFWPGSGTLLKESLIIFLVRVRTARTELGFSPSGWKAVLVSNPARQPDRWSVRSLACPATGDVLVGSSSVMVMGSYLYAFGTGTSDQSAYLLRWPLKDACRGELSKPQWWMGSISGWVYPGPEAPKPVPVFPGAQMEFSAGYQPRTSCFLQVQTLSLMEPCLAVRTSKSIRGPWTGARCIFDPEEKASPELLIYAGKAHSVFSSVDIAFTYAVNTMNQDRILDDMSIYYPVVLKGTFTRGR